MVIGRRTGTTKTGISGITKAGQRVRKCHVVSLSPEQCGLEKAVRTTLPHHLRSHTSGQVCGNLSAVERRSRRSSLSPLIAAPSRGAARDRHQRHSMPGGKWHSSLYTSPVELLMQTANFATRTTLLPLKLMFTITALRAKEKAVTFSQREEDASGKLCLSCRGWR